MAVSWGGLQVFYLVLKMTRRRSRLQIFRAGIAAFLGGIVIAKIEQYMEPYIGQLGTAPEPLVEYALYFAISFGLGLLITFVGRVSDDMFD